MPLILLKITVFYSPNTEQLQEVIDQMMICTLVSPNERKVALHYFHFCCKQQ